MAIHEVTAGSLLGQLAHLAGLLTAVAARQTRRSAR